MFHPQISKVTPQLRVLCSTGEGKLEAFWADKIAHPTGNGEWLYGAMNLLVLMPITAQLTLNDFPYYDNYTELTRLELNHIRTANNTPRTFVFLGCGPLPLTSFCIIDQLDHPDVSILNVDFSDTAIAKASALSRYIKYPEPSMSFCCDKAGGTKHDLSDADVVYFAALVGSSAQEKKVLLRSVVEVMKPGALLVIRTAWGLRKLLYPVSMEPRNV